MTLLVGLMLSMVLDHVGVSNGGLISKTIVALFWMTVPVVTVDLGITVKKTLPSAPGGRKPARGSVGGRPVAGSRDWKAHVRTRVEVLNEALILTRRFLVGRRSTVVEKGASDSGVDGGVSISFWKVTGPKARVAKSRLGLSVSVIATDWAGAVAVGWLSK